MRILIIILLTLGWASSYVFSQTIKQLQYGTKTSIRGLSVVDDQVAWVSGSNGWISKTSDGGITWKWIQIPGYDKFDFRDIEAFSKTEAIIVSAGSPAVVLVTINGGENWQETYRNETPEIFLDGMDFSDRNSGIIYGDPISGKMQLLKTSDGGQSWQNISNNLNSRLVEGEASFAASGTGVRIVNARNIFIVSGGVQSRLFVSRNLGVSWKSFSCPIIQGKNSTGPFSIAFLDKRKGIAVGGDYLSDTSSTNNTVLTKNGGKSWYKPDTSPFGYKSSVEYLTSKIIIATGTSGTDISKNGGKDWTTLSKEGYNTVRKSKTGNLILLVGAGGKIAILQSP